MWTSFIAKGLITVDDAALLIAESGARSWVCLQAADELEPGWEDGMNALAVEYSREPLTMTTLSLETADRLDRLLSSLAQPVVVQCKSGAGSHPAAFRF